MATAAMTTMTTTELQFYRIVLYMFLKLLSIFVNVV